jgi:DNA-binding response OmpR family regulator
MTERRLLILDDEPAICEFVSRAAVGQGFEVRATTRATDFMAAFKEFKPTHIILDVLMPEMDGIELIQWLAKAGCTARIAVITGGQWNYAKAAEKLGTIRGLPSITTLRKPVSLADLRAVLT